MRLRLSCIFFRAFEQAAIDVDAIRFFYHMSDTPPAEPFCTDEDLAVDLLCALLDRGADPLRDSVTGARRALQRAWGSAAFHGHGPRAAQIDEGMDETS
jgi:hypothetical protein